MRLERYDRSVAIIYVFSGDHPFSGGFRTGKKLAQAVQSRDVRGCRRDQLQACDKKG